MFNLLSSPAFLRALVWFDASTGLFGTGSASIRATQDLQIISGLPPLVREDDQFRAQITLREELEVARIYQRIEQLRLGDRLQVRWKVADLPAEVLFETPLHRVVEAHHGVRHAQAEAPGPERVVGHRHAGAVDAIAAGEVGAAAAAGKREPGVEQRVEGATVEGMAAALEDHLAIGVQAEARQRGELRGGGPGTLARWVEVFDADAPLAAVVSRMQPTPEGREHRAPVKGARGRGREAPDVGRQGAGG